MQLLPSQGVVEIKLDHRICSGNDGGIHDLIVLGAHFKFEARFEGNILREFSARHVKDAVRVNFAIPILGLHNERFAVASFQTFQLGFEAGNDIVVTLQKEKRILGISLIYNLAIDSQGEGEVDDNALFDLGGFFYCHFYLHLVGELSTSDEK